MRNAILGNDLKLGRENLTKLFFFATAQTHFCFLGNFFDQIGGVAMGSPLAPVLANLFMGHHEKRWLENYNSGIEFYRRYVDDTFALFNTEQDALSFFSYINSQHPNIKLTMEREKNHKLPFLDVLLDNHSRFSTRRPTLVFSLIILVLYLLVTN